MANGAQEINISEWTEKLTLEAIGQAGLGYSFGAFEGRNDKYRKALGSWLWVQQMPEVYSA